ncbi:fatty-acid-binding protein 1 [Gastrolobium bilobum]|uniref:fatty-acid-binding protein 1 n=1 Tax=Gastrolobium bilobum TaxID=150636 RepID=UPI002AB157DA|nr:fatty-acid-binding protein 1 [Gastrolobium bilobum]
MWSLRFPFSFSLPQPPQFSRPFSAFAAAATAGATAAFVAVSSSSHDRPFLRNFIFSSDHSLPLWGSLSMADDCIPTVESKNGASFPSALGSSLKLCGIGVRKKSIFGLKNIDVYEFGVYVDDTDIKNYLSEKYGELSISQLKGNKEFTEDVLENDISMKIKLQIVYGKLSIRSVRNAFEETVGSRLKKYEGSDNKELLQRFTSQFKDEFKIPRGSVIDLSREKGHVLRTSIDGQEVGTIQSKLLCRSILDLYIGEQPFDKQAKEDIEFNMASYLREIDC